MQHPHRTDVYLTAFVSSLDLLHALCARESRFGRQDNSSRVMRKQTMWFPDRFASNRAVQAQKMVRGWKFRMHEKEELHYRSSENKGADQLRSYCGFVFAYAECLFSNDVVH